MNAHARLTFSGLATEDVATRTLERRNDVGPSAGAARGGSSVCLGTRTGCRSWPLLPARVC